MGKQLEVKAEFHTDPCLLASVRALVRGFAQSCGVPGERIDGIVLGVDEACTNVIRHAYAGATDQRFWVTLRNDDEGLEVELLDLGEPAPPDCYTQRPLAPRGPGSLPVGGLGVHLVNQVFDEVEFVPGTERGNRIRLRVYATAASS